jgi:hypothetical protein
LVGAAAAGRGVKVLPVLSVAVVVVVVVLHVRLNPSMREYWAQQKPSQLALVVLVVLPRLQIVAMV